MIDIPQGIPSQIIDSRKRTLSRPGGILGLIGAAQKATDAAETLPSSAKDAMTKAMSFAENNVNAAFDLAQKLVRAKDVSESRAAVRIRKVAKWRDAGSAKELGAVATGRYRLGYPKVIHAIFGGIEIPSTAALAVIELPAVISRGVYLVGIAFRIGLLISTSLRRESDSP